MRKVQALIDALLSDDWPSPQNTRDNDPLPLLRRLVRRHYLCWRPFDKGEINKQSIISHPVRVQASSGDSVELIDLIAGPDIGNGPHIPLVRSVLATLDPVEQEVLRTYADFSGRRSWGRAARDNGQPASFGLIVALTRLLGLFMR